MKLIKLKFALLVLQVNKYVFSSDVIQKWKSLHNACCVIEITKMQGFYFNPYVLHGTEIFSFVLNFRDSPWPIEM